MQTAAAAPPVKAVSLLPQYAPPKGGAKAGSGSGKRAKEKPDYIPVIVPDPYGQGEPAVLRDTPKRGQERNPQASEWIAPARRPIEVRASKRDVIAGMHRRGQIDDAMFAAARDYERWRATATTGLGLRGIDPSAPVVSGGRGPGPESALDAVKQAARELRRVEKRVRRTHGADALSFCRDVLGEGLTIELAAKARGEGNRPHVEWWGGTVRRCLETLAEATGYAVRGAYAARRRAERRRQREEERRRERERESEERRAKPKGRSKQR